MTLPPPSPLGISFHTADSCGVEEKALKMASLTRQSPPSLPLGTSNHRTRFYQFVIRSRAPKMESLTRYDPPPNLRVPTHETSSIHMDGNSKSSFIHGISITPPPKINKQKGFRLQENKRLGR